MLENGGTEGPSAAGNEEDLIFELFGDGYHCGISFLDWC